MTGLRDENTSASMRLPRAKTAEPSDMDISIGENGALNARPALNDLSNVGLSGNVFKHTAASQARRALTSKTTNGAATNKPAVKPTFSAAVAGLSRTRQPYSNNPNTQQPSNITRASSTTTNPYTRPQRASLQTKSVSADFSIPVFQSKTGPLDVPPMTRKRPSQGAKDMEMPRLAARGGKHHQTMETFAYREEGPLAKKHKQEEDKTAVALEAEQEEVIRRPLIQVLAPGATGIDVEHDDLDAEDIDDPMAAGEYVDEIFTHLYNLEEEYQPNPRYIDDQKSLSWNTRAVLIDWLVEVHQKFRLLPETLFLAVNIVDRFMSRRVVALNKVQLVGITSLLLATKYEEVFTPALSNFVYVVDGSYPEDEILRAERFILQVLQFNLSYPNPMNFLRRISKADDFDIHSRTFGKYLCEIALVDHTFMEFKHSLVAAAAMHVGRMMLARSQWTNNLVYYSGGYTQKDIAPVCRKIFQFLIGPVEHEAFFKKYATKKFLKASIIAREWALGVQEQIKNGVNSYELDEGVTWNPYRFSEDLVKVDDISTVPNDNSRRFLLTGKSPRSKGEQSTTVHIDFSGLSDRQCKLDESNPDRDDYELWSPRNPTQQSNCLFGHETQYYRKLVDSKCYIGRQLIQPHKVVQDCECTREDFECDFNYVRDRDGTCKLVKGASPPDHALQCKENPNLVEYYESTGYRRIPLSTCKGGQELDKADAIPCPGKKGEFSKKHGGGLGVIGTFFVIIVPIAMACVIGFIIFQHYQSKFGVIRLGDEDSFSSSSSNPVVQQALKGLAYVVAGITMIPEALKGVGEFARGIFGHSGSSNRPWSRDYAPVDINEDDELLGDDIESDAEEVI